MCCTSIVSPGEMLHLWMGSSPSVIFVFIEMWSWKLNLEGRVEVN